MFNVYNVGKTNSETLKKIQTQKPTIQNHFPPQSASSINSTKLSKKHNSLKIQNQNNPLQTSMYTTKSISKPTYLTQYLQKKSFSMTSTPLPPTSPTPTLLKDSFPATPSIPLQSSLSSESQQQGNPLPRLKSASTQSNPTPTLPFQPSQQQYQQETFPWFFNTNHNPMTLQSLYSIPPYTKPSAWLPPAMESTGKPPISFFRKDVKSKMKQQGKSVEGHGGGRHVGLKSDKRMGMVKEGREDEENGNKNGNGVYLYKNVSKGKSRSGGVKGVAGGIKVGKGGVGIGMGIGTVSRALIPARLKVTQIPVMTLRPAMVIEATGDVPGTFKQQQGSTCYISLGKNIESKVV